MINKAILYFVPILLVIGCTLDDDKIVNDTYGIYVNAKGLILVNDFAEMFGISPVTVNRSQYNDLKNLSLGNIVNNPVNKGILKVGQEDAVMSLSVDYASGSGALILIQEQGVFDNEIIVNVSCFNRNGDAKLFSDLNILLVGSESSYVLSSPTKKLSTDEDSIHSYYIMFEFYRIDL